MKELSTDLDRDQREYKDDPREGKALLIMVISALVLGIVGPMLILLYAEEIDRFTNTLAGALTIVGIFGLIGISWLISVIKKMIKE